MIQKFSSPYSGKTGPERLGLVRAQMTLEEVDAFLVPRADVHQGEEVTPRDNRLAWLTGFTGSAGFAAVLRRKAGVFVDGRYRIQVKAETHRSFTPVDWPETQLGDWLIEELSEDEVVAFDPWLHTYREITQLKDKLEPAKIELRPTENLIDRVWKDQPEDPKDPLIVHPLEFSGESLGKKFQRLAKALKDQKADAAVLTTLDAVAWLTNTRGTDLVHMPVAKAFGILHASGAVDLFIDPDKLTAAVRTHLGDDVNLHPLENLETRVQTLSGVIALDPQTVPFAIWDALNKRKTGSILLTQDPTVLPRACKNQIELAGARIAHIRDGAAMAQFLHWLDGRDVVALTEIDIVQRLEKFRSEGDLFQTISFDTICGAGPNGAIVHYRVSEKTNRKIKENDILLIDSGAQYRDGTTDVTRTLALGRPTDEQRMANTAVLKGMIRISQQRFPEGTTGGQLDSIARSALWSEGLDYAHGTGHGVGSYLSVHEGPQGISKRVTTPLQPGMILSNEPGFYQEDAFGIRIENLIYVVDTGDVSLSGARIFGFETLTYVPIDRSLIDADLLSDQERAWLNVYHESVVQKISPVVPEDTQSWLKQVCSPI